MEPADIVDHHDEVLRALERVATETEVPDGHGERVRDDRRSGLVHLGIRTPDRRRRVARGFSFTDEAADDVLRAWDGIWHMADTADVMFAVLDHYRTRVPAGVEPAFWATARIWLDRIENWAHADDLARVYSWVLDHHRDLVLPDLRQWAVAEGQWHRRVAVTSRVHYSGKHAVFLPVDVTLSVIESCVADSRERVHHAVGWVLRETMQEHPAEVMEFLEAHASVMPRAAIRRATERLTPEVRSNLL